MSVRKAQEEIDSKEFAEWQAFENIEIGEPYRSDLRQAVISQTIANSMRSRKRPYELKDFLLNFDGEKKEKKRSNSEIKTKLVYWKNNHNKNFEKGKIK